ncbi:MAG: LacI family transcriptional regulator [Vallitalea sp.]|jgi:LacI family transcriptional regulator|nr:LacI family transcriptional regulator [Vallitalea sp.]
MGNITIRDIAMRANVSSTTVSRVLNNSGYVKDTTKKKILNAIKELNYVPNAVARSLSINKTNIIGVMVPDLNNPFFTEVVQGISNVADENDLNIILCDSNENFLEKEIKYLKMLKEQRIRGLIITPTSEENKYNSMYLSLLEDLGIPIVLVDRDVKHSSFDGVFIDNVKGAHEGTEALIKSGHKYIAIIAGPNTSKPGRDRLVGYKKALNSYDIPIKDKYIMHGNFKLQSGYELTMKLMEMEVPPTAIFSSNNLMTLGCVKALRRLNLKIPEDIALIGFDEIEIFNILDLNISVISRPTHEMGKLAMKILLEKINKESSDDSPTKRLILSPKLLLKGSEKYNFKG